MASDEDDAVAGCLGSFIIAIGTCVGPISVSSTAFIAAVVSRAPWRIAGG